MLAQSKRTLVYMHLPSLRVALASASASDKDRDRDRDF